MKKESLGRIDMRELNSWVEVDKKSASKMIASINGKKFKGRNIRMNEADSR
jgi:ATP-dependent RNA helicase DeaD